MTTIRTIARGDRSRIVEPRRVVVRDPAEWRALWAAHAGPEAAEPAVDFESHMVAAAFAGQKPSPGHEIEIVGSTARGGSLVVLTEERSARAEGLVAAQILTSPFHIVLLARSDVHVEFADAASRRRGAPMMSARSGRKSLTPSSTGLTPQQAASLAYLAGPFSAALLLAAERTSRFVRFHAWQALIALGLLGVAALTFLALAFAMLVVSAAAFWTMLWVSAITAAAWIVVWALCLFHAYNGRLWKLPLAGSFAERRAGLSR